jgi:glycosyltransferase involved in cell wall biosynthesis
MKRLLQSIEKRFFRKTREVKLKIKTKGTKQISICFAITFCNEVSELDSLLQGLLPYVEDQDEILLLGDKKNVTEEAIDIAQKYNSRINKIIYAELNGDFASFKNHISLSASKQYIFQIDADEIPHPELLMDIHSILSTNKVDVVAVPRINVLVENSIFGWDGYYNNTTLEKINFPDYQWRIYKNTPEIRWKNKVHEIITGHKTYAFLNHTSENCLLHCKTHQKQQTQNAFYDQLAPSN